MLAVLDLLGIAVFAVSGALAAVRARLDLFGVVVLATTTALGGGVIRDVLLGITPPSALRHWPNLVVPLVVALVVSQWRGTRRPSALMALGRAAKLADALGLALFVVTGTSIALTAHAPPVTASVVGVISGIGGGIMRDMLVNEIPMVLRREIYAIAAIAGAAAVAGGHWLGLPDDPVQLSAAILVAVIRVVALWRRWDAPTPRRPYEDDGEQPSDPPSPSPAAELRAPYPPSPARHLRVRRARMRGHGTPQPAVAAAPSPDSPRPWSARRRSR